MSHYDAVIIGAGPVGLILAIGLAKQGKSVAIVEKEAVQQSPSFDGRVLALTNGSMNVLDSLGLWNDLQAVTTEIKHVHVSQKGYLGLTQIHADEMNVDALGYSVTSADLGKELWKKAEEEAKIKILSEAELVSFESDNQEVQLKITRGGGAKHFLLRSSLVQMEQTQRCVRF